MSTRRTKAKRRESFRAWQATLPGMGRFARAWRNLEFIERTEDFGDDGPYGELAKMRALIDGLQRACVGRAMPPHGPLATLTASDELALEWKWPDGRVTVVVGPDAQDTAHWEVMWRTGATRGHRLLWGTDAKEAVDLIVSLVCPR